MVEDPNPPLIWQPRGATAAPPPTRVAMAPPTPVTTVGAICQLCGKEGHTIIHCFKRYDASFTGPPQKSTASATSSCGVNTNWYMDVGATDHIIGELDKLIVRDKYTSNEQVHAALVKLVTTFCIPK